MDNSVTKIPCTLLNFFKYWLQFTSPLHRLQKKEIEVFAYILKKRYELSYMIADDNLIDSYLFSTDIRKQMCDESGEKVANFQVILSKLRKQGVITSENKINKKFIPLLSKDSVKFDLMIIFDIKHDT